MILFFKWNWSNHSGTNQTFLTSPTWQASTIQRQRETRNTAANIKQQKQNANGRTTSNEHCQSKLKTTLSIFTPLQLHSETTIQHLSSGKLPLAICVPGFWLHSWCFSTRASRSRRRAFTCCKQKYLKKIYIKITSAVYYQFAKERRQQLNKCFDHATASSPRDSNDSQGPEPLSGSRGLHWQVKDQSPCLGPGGFPTAVHTVTHTSAVVPTTTTLGISIMELCPVTNIIIAESNPESWNSYHNKYFASWQ